MVNAPAQDMENSVTRSGSAAPAAAAAEPGMSQAAVEISHLHKTYGTLTAVDDVSFTVAEGEIFGILGPNGAGKTTTVECAVGLRSPRGPWAFPPARPLLVLVGLRTGVRLPGQALLPVGVVVRSQHNVPVSGSSLAIIERRLR